MDKLKIVLIDNPDKISHKNENLYLTFSKSCYKRLKNDHKNIEYFFELENLMDEEQEIENLESALYYQTKVKGSFRWIFVAFTFIYRILIQYNAIYNRLHSLIKKHPNIQAIEASTSISILFKKAIENSAKEMKINLIYNETPSPKFSYPHSQLIASDIPENNSLDNNNFFLILIAKILKLNNHKVFVLDSQIQDKTLSLFRISYLKIIDRARLFLLESFSKNNTKDMFYRDFMRSNMKNHELDRKVWKFFRGDQIELIQLIVNNFYNYYSSTYINELSYKIELLFIKSGTKKIITDDINTPLRRLITQVARINNIEVEHLPHGLYSESDYPFIDKANYMPAKLLAWNLESSKKLNNKGWSTEIIRFPFKTVNAVKKDNIDFLVMLGHGDRIDLNSFEDHTLDLVSILKKHDVSVTWKYHELINQSDRLDTSSNMLIQKDRVERLLGYKINLHNPLLDSQSLMLQHKKIIFMTWTTGILFAAMHNIPFIVYKNSSATSGFNQDKPINLFNNIELPFAENLHQIENFIVSKTANTKYLDEITTSLKSGLNLNKYIMRNID